MNVSKAHLLSVESPYDHRLDIGSNSYNIMKVRAAFSWAYKELTFTDSKTGASTLLSRILPIESFSFAREPQIVEEEQEPAILSKKNERKNLKGLHTKRHLDSMADFDEPRTKKQRRNR